MKVYDKVKWHIDGGEDATDVIKRFSIIIEYLYNTNMLNSIGVEIYHLGVDEETVIHSEMLLDNGISFMDEFYDRIASLKTEDIYDCLNSNC